MYVVSLSIPAIAALADQQDDDAINDPCLILIAAEVEPELLMDESELGCCTKCSKQFTFRDWVWDNICMDCM